MTASRADRERVRRQLFFLTVTEVRRSLLSRQVLGVLLLVGMPLALMLLRALFMPDSLRQSPSRAVTEFGEVFQVFLLRFIVFFANALIFVRLFRGEILEQTLHYSLLTPVRREHLVLGKFMGGLATSLLLLLPTTVLSYLLIFVPHRGGLQLMMSPSAAFQLLAYLFIVVLAGIAYGALFLLAGLFFKNPMVPAVIFLGWEMLTPFLPPLLKYLSFVHYLASFAPVPVGLRAFTILAEPVAPWAALLALIGASAFLLALAGRVARRLEISYAID